MIITKSIITFGDAPTAVATAEELDHVFAMISNLVANQNLRVDIEMRYLSYNAHGNAWCSQEGLQQFWNEIPEQKRVEVTSVKVTVEPVEMSRVPVEPIEA